eukprot:TRINITY_DN82358_c0_g1_i1.p1 TRINITY_DN82358_c0_g1~~TRINITY_DN82358_c0_g1_i1.p1  ORF type:complete len:301 (-),score=69.75 TRINITY_DN82358_c0_g1_i1:38-940(-)
MLPQMPQGFGGAAGLPPLPQLPQPQARPGGPSLIAHGNLAFLQGGLLTPNPAAAAQAAALAAAAQQQQQAALKAAQEAAGAGQGPIDPDVQEFCDRFQIEPRLVRMLNDELNKRPDTWETDLLALYEIIENARVPAGLLMVKLKEMQNGTFVGKPKPDEKIEKLAKKFSLDGEAVQRLAEVFAKHPNRDDGLGKLERHMEVSNKPSALIMMFLGKLRKGEDIGEPTRRAAPGSWKYQNEVKSEMGGKGGGGKGGGRDRRDDRGGGGGRDRRDDRDDRRDRRRRDSRSRSRGDRRRSRSRG